VGDVGPPNRAGPASRAVYPSPRCPTNGGDSSIFHLCALSICGATLCPPLRACATDKAALSLVSAHTGWDLTDKLRGLRLSVPPSSTCPHYPTAGRADRHLTKPNHLPIIEVAEEVRASGVGGRVGVFPRGPKPVPGQPSDKPESQQHAVKSEFANRTAHLPTPGGTCPAPMAPSTTCATKGKTCDNLCHPCATPGNRATLFESSTYVQICHTPPPPACAMSQGKVLGGIYP